MQSNKRNAESSLCVDIKRSLKYRVEQNKQDAEKYRK